MLLYMVITLVMSQSLDLLSEARCTPIWDKLALTEIALSHCVNDGPPGFIRLLQDMQLQSDNKTVWCII